MDPFTAPASTEGDLLHEPDDDRRSRAQLTGYLRWLASERALHFEGYQDLWHWSVSDLEGFWSTIYEWGGLGALPAAPLLATSGAGAEHGRFGAASTGNYVDQVLRHDAGRQAVIAVDEQGLATSVTYGELAARAGAAAAGLRRLGVGPGDRVAAVLPNGLEAVVALLATASLGAIWSSCAPEFGAASMVDRFRQIEPKVLIVADGYRYAGRPFDLADKTAALETALGGNRPRVVVPVLGTAGAGSRGQRARIAWADLCSTAAALAPAGLPGDHPLWILYSSGTTGLPKAIVHSHAGIALEHTKVLRLHQDIGVGDRFFWYTTTGWMMWNYLVGGLLVGATIVCYDGSPLHPDPLALWRLAADHQVTCLGVSAPYLDECRKSGLVPGAAVDLSRLRTIGSTGAPLSPETHGWTAHSTGEHILVGSISGGTDVCTAFLASCPLLPVRAGELQCRALGAPVAAFDADGHTVIGEVGELVVTAPMPSMPIELWGDVDGRRLHESYFAHFPGIWRHGDWVKLTVDGGAVVYGRSDATMNRGGIRTGTAELYRIVDHLDGVRDSLAVDTSELGRDGELIVLVVLEGDATLEQVTDGIRAALRRELSPRHVPDRVLAVAALPRTLNGKKVEVPVRRILLGARPSDVVSLDALADPAAFGAVIEALKQAGLL